MKMHQLQDKHPTTSDEVLGTKLKSCATKVREVR
jgi:hypothetical protein